MLLYKIASWVLKQYISLVLWTNKIEVSIPKLSAAILQQNKTCLLLFWHGRMAIMPALMRKLYPNHKFAAVISQHKDGDYLHHFVKQFRHDTIRGSSSRGGVNAIKGILAALHNKQSIVITPDGPRGPAMRIGGTTITLAQKYELPIIYISFTASKAHVFNSWDKFLLPIPFGKIKVICSAPWYCDQSRNKNDWTKNLEEKMVKQQEELDKLFKS